MNMGQRSQALAEAFEKEIGELEAAVERCSDAQWKANCPGEEWSVGVTAQHIVGQFPLEFEYLTPLSQGKALPGYSWDDINGKNDKRAAGDANVSRQDVLSLLRSERTRIAGWLRGLDDGQLDNQQPLALADGASVSTQNLIEGGVLIDHVRGHTNNIKAALG
jgi:hypothetical protein